VTSRLTHEQRVVPAVLVIVALGALAGVGQVEAREPNAAASELDVLGKEAYRDQRYEDAVAAFEGAYEADPLPRFLFNLARCHEKLGDLARASHYFDRYLAGAPEAQDRERVKALAKMLKLKLKKHSSRVIVTSMPDGALVVLRGDEVLVEGATPLSEWLPFGEHELTVSFEGHDRHVQEVIVRPGSTSEIAVELKPRAAVSPEPRPAPEPAPTAGQPAPAEQPAPEPAPTAGQPAPAEQPAPEPPGSATAETLPPEEPGPLPDWPVLTSFGLAGTLVATGGVFAVLASMEATERDELMDESHTRRVALSEVRAKDDDAHSKALTSNVLFGAGALVAVAGGVLLLLETGDTPEEPDGASGGGDRPPSLQVARTPTGAMLMIGGRL